MISVIIKSIGIVIDIFSYLYVFKAYDWKNRKLAIEKNKKLLWLLLLFMELIIHFSGIHIVYNYMLIGVTIILAGKICGINSFKYKIVITSIYISYIALAKIITYFYVFLKTGTDCVALFGEFSSYDDAILQIIVLLLIVSSIKLIWKIPRQMDILNWITICIPLLTNMVFFLVFADEFYYNTSNFTHIFSIVTVLVVGVVMLFGCLCNVAVAENYLEVKRIENETNMQINEIKTNFDYYRQLSKDMDKVRRISHDIKNHLWALGESPNGSKRERYFESIMEELSDFENHYDTGNSFIDNILYIKKKEAIECNIDLDICVSLEEFIIMDDKELCTIFSNLLDNAIRECKEVLIEENKESEIILRTEKKRGFFLISCQNTLRRSQEQYLQGGMETTKVDKKNHGFGIKNIVDTIHNHGGEYSIKINDGVFKFVIIIPL